VALRAAFACVEDGSAFGPMALRAGKKLVA
jgi:hypothetical protein